MALLYERRSGPFPELLDYPLPVLKSAASAAERRAAGARRQPVTAFVYAEADDERPTLSLNANQQRRRF